MNKHIGRFLLPPLVLITLLLQFSISISGQRSKGIIGRHEVLVINNSGRLLWIEAWTPRSYRRFPLPAEDDVILESVKVIRVAGTAYSLNFKNRYTLLWDEQGARPYVMRLDTK
ncbi:MAG TPA: hypothetical protein VJR02_22765 [Pyrinomonadaceae bacterium]|nr:hypothetical protein [Pyrinomonadaceae bacterium]